MNSSSWSLADLYVLAVLSVSSSTRALAPLTSYFSCASATRPSTLALAPEDSYFSLAASLACSVCSLTVVFNLSTTSLALVLSIVSRRAVIASLSVTSDLSLSMSLSSTASLASANPWEVLISSSFSSAAPRRRRPLRLASRPPALIRRIRFLPILSSAKAANSSVLADTVSLTLLYWASCDLMKASARLMSELTRDSLNLDFKKVMFCSSVMSFLSVSISLSRMARISCITQGEVRIESALA